MAQTFFNGAELDQLRAIATSAFDQVCDILGSTANASNNAGGRSAAGANQNKVATNIACHVVPDNREPVEIPEAGQMVSRKRFKVKLPWNQPVSPRQRIAVQGGAIYDVLASDYGRSYATEVIAECYLAV